MRYSQAFPVKSIHTGAFKGPDKAMGYFEELIWQYHQEEEPCVFLPSLPELSKSLGCSALEIQSALTSLRKQGYDYFMIDMYGPITLWYPDRIAALMPEDGETV